MGDWMIQNFGEMSGRRSQAVNICITPDLCSQFFVVLPVFSPSLRRGRSCFEHRLVHAFVRGLNSIRLFDRFLQNERGKNVCPSSKSRRENHSGASADLRGFDSHLFGGVGKERRFRL